MSRSIEQGSGGVQLPSAVPVGARRVGYLDGARAIAALFVLVHHTYCMAYPIRDGIEPTGILGYAVGWMVYGHFGVTVFIVLAGYSLFIALAHGSGRLPGSVFGFVKRRAWRILPPFWAALLITIVLVLVLIGSPTGTHWDQSVPTSPKGWVVDALLLQDIIPVQDAAYTFWSISVEWHIYFLVPVTLFIRTRSTWVVAIAFGAGLGVLGMVLTAWSEKFGRLHPEYYVVFAIAAGGCLIVAHAPTCTARALDSDLCTRNHDRGRPVPDPRFRLGGLELPLARPCARAGCRVASGRNRTRQG
ncbi:peptidoglycan/LPS O-acetylase OafA/YrhL [Mycetocola sp. CAN_C7]